MHRLDWTHGPLHYRAFRHALIARVVSAGGSWMQTVAAGWLVYQLTHSAAAVGVLTVMSRAPGIALSSVGGQLAQRHDPRRVALALAFLQVIPAMLLAVVSWLDADTEVAIYLLVLAGSVLGALATAPTSWISSHSVPQELTKKAIGESSFAYNLARFVGPLLGGGLVTAVGAGWCFAINAATYLVMAWAVWTLPRRSMPHEDKPVRFVGAVRRTLAHPLLGVVLLGSITQDNVSRAICIWEAPSLDDLQRLLDGMFGAAVALNDWAKLGRPIGSSRYCHRHDRMARFTTIVDSENASQIGSACTI